MSTKGSRPPRPTGLRTIAQLVTIAAACRGRGLRPCLLAVGAGRRGCQRHARTVRRRRAFTWSRLPTTNLYLQGAWDRTPLDQRGITRAARGRRARRLARKPCHRQRAGRLLSLRQLRPAGDLRPRRADGAPGARGRLARRHHREPRQRAPGSAWDGRIAPALPGRPACCWRPQTNTNCIGPARAATHRHPRRPVPGEQHNEHDGQADGQLRRRAKRVGDFVFMSGVVAVDPRHAPRRRRLRRDSRSGAHRAAGAGLRHRPDVGRRVRGAHRRAELVRARAHPPDRRRAWRHDGRRGEAGAVLPPPAALRLLQPRARPVLSGRAAGEHGGGGVALPAGDEVLVEVEATMYLPQRSPSTSTPAPFSRNSVTCSIR